MNEITNINPTPPAAWPITSTQLTTLTNAISTVGAPTSYAETVQSPIFQSSATITFGSSTTTTLSANTVLFDATSGSSIIPLANFGPAGGRVFITKALIQVIKPAVPAWAAGLTAHFFNAAPTGFVDAENIVFDVATAGDFAKWMGSISLTAPALGSSACFSDTNPPAEGFQLATGSTTGYMVCVTTAGGARSASTISNFQFFGVGA